MELLNQLMDTLYFGMIEPFFRLLAGILELLILKPLQMTGLPIWLQVCVVAVLTVILAFRLRILLRVEEKTKAFNEKFGAMHSQQQDFKLIDDQKSRRAMYQSSDDDLNDTYNSFLAGHYGRYVSIYLIPLCLILAWLNNIYSAEVLRGELGSPFVIPLAENSLGTRGLSVTFVFLCTYVIGLIIGFRLRRYSKHRAAAAQSVAGDRLEKKSA
ncbi:MAG: hypothetical protein ABFS19_08005 [Thermodesulfobacteriota bacterium]